MKIVKITRYVRHSAYREHNPVNGSPAVHAMRRGQMVAVDANAFLYAESMYDDAVYPDEPDGQDAGRDPLVAAMFAKGGTYYSVLTRASELARVLGLPDRWFGR